MSIWGLLTIIFSGSGKLIAAIGAEISAVPENITPQVISDNSTPSFTILGLLSLFALLFWILGGFLKLVEIIKFIFETIKNYLEIRKLRGERKDTDRVLIITPFEYRRMNDKRRRLDHLKKEVHQLEEIIRHEEKRQDIDMLRVELRNLAKSTTRSSFYPLGLSRNHPPPIASFQEDDKEIFIPESGLSRIPRRIAAFGLRILTALQSKFAFQNPPGMLSFMKIGMVEPSQNATTLRDRIAGLRDLLSASLSRFGSGPYLPAF